MIEPDFIACLFEPADLLEIRLLPSRRQLFATVADLPGLGAECARANADGQNIFVGANPRKRNGGKAADVLLARCLFADLDGTDPAAGLQRIEAAGLPAPTVSVASGHGLHCWWRLAEPLSDFAEWTAKQLNNVHICHPNIFYCEISME